MDETRNRLRGKYVYLPLILILLFVFPVVKPPLFFLTLFFSVFMYVGLTESWNLMGGYTGYISLGHIAFFSTGAYTTAVLMNRFGASPFATAILGGLFASIVAALVGYPVLRLKGAYFTISSMLLSVVMQLIFMNWEFVGSSTGLWYKLLPVSIETNRFIFYEVMLGLATVITLLVRWVEKSKFGAGLIAIREDEDVAKTMGINTPRLKIRAFILGAFLAGVVGGVYGYYMSYVHPEVTFNINTSLLLLLMSFFGGCRTWTGPLLGAVVLSLMNQLIVTFIGAEISRIIYGLLLVIVIIFMPDGVLQYIKGMKKIMD
ncbi:MAG TPA: branched-chain amino acid ABC transporter permease [Thermodesulfobacteriota bacterium]|nr:branched-chain amino acid ABC transporter permease [Thermodesulfobacteriota bacterium]